jgi:hypothetical protein
MAKMMTVEVFVCVNECEEFVAHECQETCGERMREEYTSDITRMVKVVLTIPVPDVVTMTGTVPAEPTEGTLAVSDATA